jgi:nitrogen regulatory protein PII
MNISLIVSIVRKGWGSTVLQAAVQAGARGGTIFPGRGAGIHEQAKIFGTAIEPEKEIVMTLVFAEQVETILPKVVEAAELNQMGRGIAFVVPVDRVVGVAQFMSSAPSQPAG